MSVILNFHTAATLSQNPKTIIANKVNYVELEKLFIYKPNRNFGPFSDDNLHTFCYRAKDNYDDYKTFIFRLNLNKGFFWHLELRQKVINIIINLSFSSVFICCLSCKCEKQLILTSLNNFTAITMLQYVSVRRKMRDILFARTCRSCFCCSQ